MPGLNCKTVSCVGGCLDSIVVDNAREITEGAVKLAASGLLREDQMADLIDLYEDFESSVKRRKKEDRELRGKTKAILLG